jgi:pyroglutamyl-peptidase
MARVLLTGFEPFGDIAGNASWEAVSTVADRAVDGATITAVRLPVTFEGAPGALADAIEESRPDLVLATGQAAGRKAVTVERVAINMVNAPIPDNEGLQPIGEPLIDGAPDAYFTNLPLRACVAAARKAGIPTAESLTAGSYVCNAVFYRLMHEAATRRQGLVAGFVHVPLTPAQSLDGAHPTMPAEVAADAIAAIVRTALASEPEADLALATGTVH